MTVEERLERIERLLQATQQAPEFYSIRQAAAVVGVSPDHIRRAVVSGTLPCANVGTAGRPTYRIARADLLAWVEKQKAGPLSPARRRPASVPVSRHHRRSGAPDS